MQGIFQKAQKSHVVGSKELRKILDGKDRKEFMKEFLRNLQLALVRPQDDRYANNVVQFAVEFVVGLEGNLSTTLNMSSISETQKNAELRRNAKIMKNLIEFLLKTSSAACPIVRARSCEMIGKILKEMSDEAEIDYELSLAIEKKMLSRTRDKISAVRVAAFSAVTRLQDPANEDCRVTKACLAHLELDPCPEVRRMILDMLEPSKRSLANVLERCRDVNDYVRKAAYAFLASNLHLSTLTTDQRMEILNQGLHDRSNKVQSFCSKTLLDKWIERCDKNPLTFVKYLCLDEPLHIAAQVLNKFFQGNKPEDIVKYVDFVDEEHNVQVDKLTEENVFYWKTLCIYFNSLGSCDKQLEVLLPDIPILCGVVKELSAKRDPINDIEKCYENDFICEQFIDLIGVHEFIDSCCMKNVEQFICETLSDVNNISLVPSVMRHLPEAVPDMNRGIDMMLELISNLTEPLVPVEVNMNENDKHQLDMKMAALRVQIISVGDLMDQCVRDQDFEKAGQMKLKLAMLEKEREDLKELHKPILQDVRIQKNDPATMEMCLTIVYELYHNYKPKVLTPGLRMLLDSLILNGIQCLNRNVKKVAVLALGHTCLLDKDLASRFFVLIIEIIRLDHPEVRIAALKVVFDFLMIHDYKNFESVDCNVSNCDGDKHDMSKSGDLTSTEIGISSRIINILCMHLNCEKPEVVLVAAEGLAKLLMCRKIVAHQVLSQLMILWYSPGTESNVQLFSMLGTFLPCYAASGRANQMCIMTAFVPTLRKICNAPHNSPIRGIKLDNLCKFFVQLTASRTLQSISADPQVCSVHVDMAMEVSKEILQNAESEMSWWLVKVLPTLELTGASLSQLVDLESFIEKLEEDIGESTLKSTLAKFKANVQNKVSAFPTNRRKRSSGNMEGINSLETM